MLASELARHGVPCRIIDRSPTATPESRALGIHARSLEIFDQIGMIAPVLAQGHPIHGVNMYADGQKLLHLSISEIESPYPYVIDLPQSETERILTEHLAGFGVQVERPVELTAFTQDEEAVTATLKQADGSEATVRAPYLVGCDGAHSEVRHVLALPFEGAPYGENFILADVRLEWLLPDDEMHAFISEAGIMAAFPMRGGHYRLIAEVPGAEGERPPTPTLEDVQRILDQRAPAGTRASEPSWLSCFRIHHRIASQTRVGRAFLVGDAAHIHSPVGGQGMNTGMQDAFNLAWKLALVLAGHARAELLDSYQAERLPIARSVVQMTDMATRLVTMRSPLVAAVRNRLAPFLAAQEVVRERAANRVSELDVNYRNSPIVAGAEGGLFGLSRFAGRPLPGDRTPDAQPLVLPDGSRGRLFDLLRGTGHTLLLLTGQGEETAAPADLAAFASAVENRFGPLVRAFVVTGSGSAGGSEPAGPGIVLDLDGALHSRYGAGPGTAYLIRPDGYVAYRRQPADRAHLQDYLGRILR